MDGTPESCSLKMAFSLTYQFRKACQTLTIGCCLLHRLGWRRIEGSGLRAERRAWEDNVDVALELLETGSLQDSSGLSNCVLSSIQEFVLLGNWNARSSSRCKPRICFCNTDVACGPHANHCICTHSDRNSNRLLKGRLETSSVAVGAEACPSMRQNLYAAQSLELWWRPMLRDRLS